MSSLIHSRVLCTIALFLTVCSLARAHGEGLRVTAINQTQLARPNQTLELSREQLASLGENDLKRIHVSNAAGEELLCQAVDSNYDAFRMPDMVIFQADFEPGQKLIFSVTSGPERAYRKDEFRAYGRFARERFDDFAWENDRIAHRTYGSALATWEGEPLSSSSVDIWSKRSPRMVINDWYMTGDYHADHGEGADFYSAGLTRGCGGTGLWAGDRLWVSRGFVDSRVLANGPIRIMFELVYEPFDVDGISVSEVKRVTLDAGQQLSRFSSHYKAYVRPGRDRPLVAAIGLKKVEGERLEMSVKPGWMAKWEPVSKGGGQQGLAVIVGPGRAWHKTEDSMNHLALVDVAAGGDVTYHAGFCWDRAGHVTDFESWKTHVANVAERLASPIQILIDAEP
jgi:hypothetical protein